MKARSLIWSLVLSLPWLAAQAAALENILSFDSRVGGIVSALDRQDLRAARAAAEESLGAIQSHFGGLRPAAGWRWEDLGLLDWRLGAMPAAEQELQKALALFVLDSLPEDQARLRLRLAQFYEEWGKPLQARVQLARALDHWEGQDLQAPPCCNLPPLSPFALRLEARQAAYRLADFFGEAEASSFLAANVKDCLKAWPRGHEKLVDAQLQLSMALLEEGKKQEAEKLLEQAHQWQDAVLSPNDVDRVPVLLGLARHLRQSSPIGEADSAAVLQQAESLLSKAISHDTKPAPEWLVQLGTVQALLHEEVRAGETMDRAAARLRKVYHMKHPAWAQFQFRLGQLSALGLYQPGSSREFFQAAGFVWSHAYGPDHPTLAACEEELGKLDEREGKHEEAKAHFTTAAGILTKHLGDDHPRVKALLEAAEKQ
jgi:tetratricopeptide (TPR) repeat protein